MEMKLTVTQTFIIGDPDAQQSKQRFRHQLINCVTRLLNQTCVTECTINAGSGQSNRFIGGRGDSLLQNALVNYGQ